MNPRAKKLIYVALAVVLLLVCSQLQKSLNRDRAALGLTISEPLQNAPPLLALTTQALGGFRGLISNFLWMRANDLQRNWPTGSPTSNRTSRKSGSMKAGTWPTISL
jgi:hypothetical protein